MTIAVPNDFDELSVDDCKIGRPASSLRLARPAATAANHCLGQRLGGMRVSGGCDPDETITKGHYRYKFHRHPNCDSLLAVLDLLDFDQDSGVINFKAGAGTTEALTVYGVTAATAHQWRRIRAAWDSGDADYCEVSVESDSIGIAGITIVDVPREELASGDDYVEYRDPSYPSIGLGEGDAIADSDTAGVEGILDSLDDAWEGFEPTLFAHACPEEHPWTVDDTAWTNPLGDGVFKIPARQKRAADEYATARAHIWCWGDATVTGYKVRVISANPGPAADRTVTSGTKTNTTLTNAAWVELTALYVDCTLDATITVEVQRTGGTGAINVASCCGSEG